LDRPYGLPIPLSAATPSTSRYNNFGNKEKVREGIPFGQLAYFTNQGPLSSPGSNSEDHSHIKTAVIGIHGSGRDASSYLCALIAAMSGPNDVSSVFKTAGKESVHRRAKGSGAKDTPLLIAPWFLAPIDGTPQSTSPILDIPWLQWHDQNPIAHTFRYGAESVEVPLQDGSKTSISSYGAMDALLDTLCNRDFYPSLQQIVVAGHSAGGQFVHRYGISSSHWCFGDSNLYPMERDYPNLRLVAANPRSFAYLDNRRYFPSSKSGTTGISHGNALSPFDELEFRSPTDMELEDCQEYNKYEWGLDDNENVPAPYVIHNIEAVASIAEVFCRYASRDIVYLSGERDRKHLGNQICDEDGYQGPSRRERSERFFSSLQVQGFEVLNGLSVSASLKGGGYCDMFMHADDPSLVHKRSLVRNVGHDHALVFQSKEGRDELRV